MKKKLFTKILSVLLAAALLAPVFRANALPQTEKNNAVPWRFEVTPEKKTFAAGENIRLRVNLENVSFTDLRDVEIDMKFTKTDTYLVSGKTHSYTDVLEYGRSVNETFDLFENEESRGTGEKYGSVLARLIRFFGWLFSNLAPFLRHTEETGQRVFNDFPGGLVSAFSLKAKETAGTCSVIYNGKEIICTFTVSYRKPAQSAPAAVSETGSSEAPFTLNAFLALSDKEIPGLFFGASNEGSGVTGGFFFADAALNRAGIARMENGKPSFISVKNVSLTPGKSCSVRLEYDGTRVKAWLLCNPLDEDPWPLFDLPFEGAGTAYGVCGTAEGFTLSDAPAQYAGETYTNPLYPNSADPFVYFEDGVYYLYATNCGDGFNVSVSTDLVHWAEAGQAAHKNNIVGEYYFWAPEVYKHNGRYYLFYSTQEHLAVAAADSPTGPFVKTSNDFLFEQIAIDGHVFIDDDGTAYLYVVHYNNGNCLWVYELNNDFISVKEGSGVQISTPQGWEKTVNEGPAMLKHNGVYYLTYSGDGYTSPLYGVGVMISSSPTGPFTRCDSNPLLQADSLIHGTGHHCFAASPDGSEMFIVYHCHNSLTEVEARRLCIDRIRFVPDENGPDRLVVYGPTVTPQPMPAGATN